LKPGFLSGFFVYKSAPKKEASKKKKRNNPLGKQKQKHPEKRTSKKPKRCQQTNAEQELT
jgi:hypothetical protein